MENKELEQAAIKYGIDNSNEEKYSEIQKVASKGGEKRCMR